MKRRLAIFTTHPIQYYAPLWRLLAQSPDWEPIVYYFSDISLRGGLDSGFGVNVNWDLPLLDGYQHVFLSRDWDKKIWKIPNAPAFLRSEKIDAVMVHGYIHRFERQAVRAARKLKLPTLLRGDFRDAGPIRNKNWGPPALKDHIKARVTRLVRDQYVRWFYSHVDAFCYVGVEAANHLRRMGIPDSRLFFAPHSVDTQLFETQRATFDRQAARRELQIADDQVAILFSGKLIPRKDPLILARAMARLAERGKATLIFVGSGELQQQVEAAAREAVGDRAIFPGFVNQSQLGKYFVAADLMVLPAWYESWGLVVNEAMQFGLPVIASREVICHRDLIREGETGFTFPAGDADALAEALRKMIVDAPGRQRMGAAARQHILAHYTTEQTVKGIEQALHAIA